MHEIEQLVLKKAEENKQELFDLLSRLIQFDTQNFITDGREKECAGFMHQIYQEMGLEAVLYSPDELPGLTQHPDFLPGRNSQARPNAEGIWPGLDKSAQADAIMLAAHTDTMPTGKLERWTYDPFGGIMDGGRIYGLGAGDNKAGLAAAVFAVRTLQSCQIRLKKPVILSAYSDEEYGGGNGALASSLRNKPETIINLDGGNYEIWTTALGGCGYKISLHKSSTTDTLMDVYRATELLMQKLDDFAKRRRHELGQVAEYAGSDMQRSAFRLFTVQSQENNLNDMDVSFVIYTFQTEAQIETELKQILTQLQADFADLDVETKGFEKTFRFFHSGRTDKSNGAFAAIIAAASEAIGRPVQEKGSCLTDLSLFLKYGSPFSLNFGILRDFALPGGAHQPDEFVDCAEFIAYAKALILFLIRFGQLAD